MVRLGMAALVAIGVIAQTEVANSTDITIPLRLSNHSHKRVINRGSAVSLPLRSTRSREQVTHRSRPHNTSQETKELLFRDFQDWLKKRRLRRR
jgi:hypothetical protein